jgi:hypothetical protein
MKHECCFIAVPNVVQFACYALLLQLLMHVQAIHAETVAPVSKMGIPTTITANVRLVGEGRTVKVSNANAIMT